ncbi:HesA/MoeB/ThiF family protein [Labilibacter marinus]|uniref:HesA/MoeB/ThiF family protein n=1 Tax=Labilibacter marinus TaxID=1477105 RepID=UPI00082D5E81|nr:HesA/MoeB/ThiF family protein [Labilibacter marinus]
MSIDLERYNRQVMLPGMGEEGQEKLSKVSVLVVGAGGLGCPVIQYLTGAGIGTIGIIDADDISLTNLQRQILYTEEEIGMNKAEVAAKKMAGLNSTVDFKVYTHFLTEENAEKLIGAYDIIVGATDNLESRYLINKYTSKLQKPFVHGAVSDFEGRFSVFNYQGSPSYSDVFPTPPESKGGILGVIGALPGTIGSHMALEVIKIAAQVGKVSNDGLYIFDGLNSSLMKLKY